VGNVHLPRQAQTLYSIGDQLDLKHSQFGRLVEVDVDADTVAVSNGEQTVDLANRVTVDGRRVKTSDVLDPLTCRRFQQVEDAGSTQDAVLGESHNLQVQGPVVLGDSLPDHFDTTQSQPGIDVNVTANCRGPMPDHLAEDGTGQGHARDPE